MWCWRFTLVLISNYFCECCEFENIFTGYLIIFGKRKYFVTHVYVYKTMFQCQNNGITYQVICLCKFENTYDVRAWAGMKTQVLVVHSASLCLHALSGSCLV